MKLLKNILPILILLTFQSCSNEINEISENDIYEFMNSAILQTEDEIKDSNKFTKLENQTMEFSESIESFISGMFISRADKSYLKKQTKQEQILFNCSRLNNVVCISNDTIEKIFGVETKTIETDSGIEIIDAWENFREKYGYGGIHKYSRPIFNRAKDLVIIEHSGQGDWTLGSGSFLVFEKKNNKWKLIDEKNLWISGINKQKLYPTQAISNCLSSPTSENPRGFSACCALVKLGANPRNNS